MSGVVGVQFRNANFSAQGAEAMLPSTGTRTSAAFAHEELPLDRLKLSVAGRVERTRVNSAGGGGDDPNNPGTPRFGVAQARDFTPVSVAFGALYALTPAWSTALNVSRNERAPSFNELFANGAHPATGQYVIGNAGLGVEKSGGLDWQIKWRGDRSTASVGAYYTRFQNYIALYNTGNTVDELPEAVTRAVAANFYGAEAEGKFHIYEGAGDADLRFKADTVHAQNRDTGEALPYLAPWHLGIGLDYRLGSFGAKLDVTHAGKQTRAPTHQLPTDAYTLVDALLTYRLPRMRGLLSAEAFLRLNNLFNAEARLATSVLKDIAPLAGRSALLGVRLDF
jgi:iron complex outermembrane receptor protein